jgi:hypothetical protein
MDEKNTIPEPPAIEEFEPTRIIIDVRRFQEWIKQTTIQAEFQAYYHMGKAMSINQTKKQQRRNTDALEINGREKTIISRVYLLFRDHIQAIGHLRGINPESIHKLSQKLFDEMLLTIEGEYPPFIDFGDELQLWLDNSEGGNEDDGFDEWDV